ncbi:hypothetical protein DERP_012948 [Dermatophagoides pteronyssinus]|uniref:Uncharacterized protein n=1 Tax=Dermatophagoides pteronyssinus TaxID=6956 RepID=A0ABQ8J3N0_DERPT|nr:hypothetical protein DERP_012948 [Dermatophagoides pteronyssinus]
MVMKESSSLETNCNTIYLTPEIKEGRLSEIFGIISTLQHCYDGRNNDDNSGGVIPRILTIFHKLTVKI